MFKLYKCKLRLQGSVLNEVPKEVTAPEIFILREIHGADAVLDVVEIGVGESRSHRAERERLARVYANPSRMTPEQAKKKVGMIRDLFGHDSMPLPTVFEDVKATEPEPLEEDDAPAPLLAPKKRAKAAEDPAFTA